jgi:hypothetical protein
VEPAALAFVNAENVSDGALGGVVSTWIAWLFTASVLPTLSRLKNLTVALPATVNAPV